MTYKVGIVGYGTQGVYHLKNINQNDDIEMTVTGCYDTDPRAGIEADEAGLHVYQSMDEMLDDTDIDVVFICTPNDSHFPYAMKAIQAGKNVLVEKPAMLSSEEMEKVTEAAEEAGLMLMVHQNRRWDPDFAVIKKVYDEKIIGEPTYLESRVHGSRGIPGDWRREKARGGGMVLDWGVHAVDRVLMMVDSPVTQVYGKRSFALGNDCDDGFRAFLTFADGFQAYFDISTTAYIPEAMYWMQSDTGALELKDWSMEGQIIRSTGVEEQDAVPIQAGVGLTKTMAPRLIDYGEFYGKTPPIEVLALPDVETDVMEFYYNVVGVLNGDSAPVITNASVIRCLRILEALIESDLTGETVHPETADTSIR